VPVGPNTELNCGAAARALPPRYSLWAVSITSVCGVYGFRLLTYLLRRKGCVPRPAFARFCRSRQQDLFAWSWSKLLEKAPMASMMVPMLLKRHVSHL